MGRIVLAAFASVTLLFIGCGSSGTKVGETCTTRGSTAECESGAVCSQNTSGVAVCLKICAQQSDCATTEDCNGVEGSSLKACRTKDKIK